MAYKELDLTKFYTAQEISDMWNNKLNYSFESMYAITFAYLKLPIDKDERIKFIRIKNGGGFDAVVCQDPSPETDKKTPTKKVYKTEDVSISDIKQVVNANYQACKSKENETVEVVYRPKLYTITELGQLAADTELPDKISRIYFIYLHLVKCWSIKFGVPAGTFKFYFNDNNICKVVFPKAIYKDLRPASNYREGAKAHVDRLVLCVEDHPNLRGVRIGCIYKITKRLYKGKDADCPTETNVSVGIEDYDSNKEWEFRLSRFYTPTRIASNLYQMMKAFYRQEEEQEKLLNL